VGRGAQSHERCLLDARSGMMGGGGRMLVRRIGGFGLWLRTHCRDFRFIACTFSCYFPAAPPALMISSTYPSIIAV
jgi:hypothetical protein